MATVVLAIAAAGVLLPFTSGAMVRTEGARRTLGAKLAADLVERIIRTDADQIVGTYDGYAEAEGEVTNSSGSVITDAAYARYSRQVNCEDVYVSQESEVAAARFVLVTVRVFHAGNEVAVVRRLVSK